MNATNRCAGILVSTSIVMLVVASAMALPNDALVCPVNKAEMDKYTYLRSLSLDLRGVVPTVQEYNSLNNKKDVPESLIDTWLASDAFAKQAVRRHRDLLWNNVTNVRMFPAPTGLKKSGQLYWRSGGGIANILRGERVPCLDEPVKYAADGQIVAKKQSDGTMREGYTMVAPFWAPSTKIKVCALDALENAVSPVTGQACSVPVYGGYVAGCGCGPNMRWCRYGSSERLVLESFATSVDKQVEQLVKDDLPYTELFTAKTMFVNGPMVFFWKHQRQMARRQPMTPTPLNLDVLPELDFEDKNTWVQIPLPSYHAGILTSSAFLLRFQTNFARANRYYNIFLCQPFQPPEGGIDLSGGPEPDLQKRPGCKYCHALLGPTAAFWGRWIQSGGGYLGKEEFPPFSPQCHTCATTGKLCSKACKTNYLVNPDSEQETPYLGMLKAYVFRQDVHKKNVEQGPRLMALGSVADNRLPRCLARSTAVSMFGRDLKSEERDWADQAALDFVQQGYSYRSIVKAVVTSGFYRRVR